MTAVTRQPVQLCPPQRLSSAPRAGPASSEGEGRRPRRISTRFFGEVGEAVTIWVFTQEGFFSVTAYEETRGGARLDGDELVVVRTRVRDDLTRLSPWIPAAE